MREKHLENKRKEMAVVVEKLNRQLEELDSLFLRQQSVKDSLEAIYTNGQELNITEVANYKDYLGKVIIDSKIQEQNITQTKHLLRFKQLEVTEALKEVKVLDKLKETQEKKFYQHYEYVQAKEIDDIASTRYKKISA